MCFLYNVMAIIWEHHVDQNYWPERHTTDVIKYYLSKKNQTKQIKKYPFILLFLTSVRLYNWIFSFFSTSIFWVKTAFCLYFPYNFRCLIVIKGFNLSWFNNQLFFMIGSVVLVNLFSSSYMQYVLVNHLKRKNIQEIGPYTGRLQKVFKLMPFHPNAA